MSNSLMYQQEESDLGASLKEHLPLVKKIALHLHSRLPVDIEVDDLIQVGLLGLMAAVDNYQPSLGASFQTYAGIRIKGAMLDEARKFGWAPRSVQQKLKTVADAVAKVESRSGEQANEAQIARELGMALDEYHEYSADLARARLLHLDEIEEEQAEYQGADANPVDSIEATQFHEGLAQAISELPEKEQLVMSLYYQEELNQKEIGQVLGVSESRVCQMHGQALARLKKKLGSWVDE